MGNHWDNVSRFRQNLARIYARLPFLPVAVADRGIAILLADTTGYRRGMNPRALFVPLGITTATVALLAWMGRRWWCACGSLSLISTDAWGAHNSQHLFDPYSFSHLLHGIIFFFLTTFAFRSFSVHARFTVAMLLESGWELLENSPLIINRYREATAALGYEGDSIINSLGDLVSCGLGFFVARALGWKLTVVLSLMIEVISALAIRDNLTLNIIMLLMPNDAIRAWQAGH